MEDGRRNASQNHTSTDQREGVEVRILRGVALLALPRIKEYYRVDAIVMQKGPTLITPVFNHHHSSLYNLTLLTRPYQGQRTPSNLRLQAFVPDYDLPKCRRSHIHCRTCRHTFPKPVDGRRNRCSGFPCHTLRVQLRYAKLQDQECRPSFRGKRCDTGLLKREEWAGQEVTKDGVATG